MYPTILIVRKDTHTNNIIEIGRISGDFTKKRWKQLISMSH